MLVVVGDGAAEAEDVRKVLKIEAEVAEAKARRVKEGLKAYASGWRVVVRRTRRAMRVNR